MGFILIDTVEHTRTIMIYIMISISIYIYIYIYNIHMYMYQYVYVHIDTIRYTLHKLHTYTIQYQNRYTF